jgi:hypothetical protein
MSAIKPLIKYVCKFPEQKRCLLVLGSLILCVSHIEYLKIVKIEKMIKTLKNNLILEFIIYI